MSWSLKIFTIRGIPIRVHGSFLLILLWSAWLGLRTREAGWPLGVMFWVAFTLLFFGCVVLHELGHSLVAQRFGVTVQDITLWPIGGIARIARLPQRPYQEFLISAAGPAVNLFLAVILGAAAVASIGPARLLEAVTSPYQLERLLTGVSVGTMLLLLALNNLLLALFNLIPAFPMDGGRLVRSALAVFMPFGRATKIASWLGQGAALAMAAVALLSGSLFLGLVAAFVFVAAWGERQQAVTGDHLRGMRVGQAMQPVGVRLHPLETLGAAAARVAALPQAAYLVVEAGRLLGILSRRDLLAALRKGGPAARVGQHLSRAFVLLAPSDSLIGADERLAQAQPPFGIVVQDGQAVGLLGRGDIARLVETLEAYPAALPRE
jgi:Zn-dependent protease/CBS domain-containing protein